MSGSGLMPRLARDVPKLYVVEEEGKDQADEGGELDPVGNLQGHTSSLRLPRPESMLPKVSNRPENISAGQLEVDERDRVTVEQVSVDLDEAVPFRES